MQQVLIQAVQNTVQHVLAQAVQNTDCPSVPRSLPAAFTMTLLHGN